MRILFTPFLIVFFALSVLGQKKTHPNNPGVILTDETPEKWRVLSDQNNYLESASELIYLVLSDTTRNRHVDFWHIGQMYAMADQYDKAKFYMTKAVSDPADEQWMWYFNGTIAFLERDKASLEKFAKLLDDNHTRYYTANSRILNRLLENFEKTYKESY